MDEVATGGTLVWESGWWLGPTVSVAHGPADVDRYLEFLAEVT